MTTELADLVDGEDDIFHNLKENIFKEFFESSASGKWFYSLTMMMVSYALTELVDAICQGNPGVTMTSVVDMYNNKDAKCPRFPWEVSKEVEMDGSTANSDNELDYRDSEESESSIMGLGWS